MALQHKVSRTINYVNSDGTPSGISSHHDSLTFNETRVIDKVTGQYLTGQDQWDGPKDFKSIDSPHEDGYTPDYRQITNTGIDHDHGPITETVTYKPDQQTATVTYIDDTTGQTLHTDTVDGVSNQDKGYKLNGHAQNSNYAYSTAGTITQYENQGYEKVSDSTNGESIVLDHDDKTNQAYTVHFKHGTVTVSPTDPGKPNQPINPHDTTGPKYPQNTDQAGLQHIVHRTIHYVYPDGTTVTTPHQDSLTFDHTEVIDKVTGQVIHNSWSKDQDFPDVASPAQPGYTPDQSTVTNTGIGHDHPDVDETVTYTPDPQTATLTYIDDTTGQTLATKTLSGHSDEHSGYTTTETIDGY